MKPLDLLLIAAMAFVLVFDGSQDEPPTGVVNDPFWSCGDGCQSPLHSEPYYFPHTIFAHSVVSVGFNKAELD